MRKEWIVIIFALVCAVLFFRYILHSRPECILYPPVLSVQEGDRPILLVPLDSRPPCTDFVVNGGKIVSREILLPPSEIMDYYTQPGSTADMRAWLAAHIEDSSAVILSVDQLLSGGLIAAREAHISREDIEGLASYLRALHGAHPDVPLHAFYILPRAAAQDSIDRLRARRALLSYARLLGRMGEGVPVDADELSRLHGDFTNDELEKYLAHFEESTALAAMLIELTEEGVLARLVLGQDDGEPYSVGNLKKQELSTLLSAKHIPADRAVIVHGADEIALTMLARLAVDEMRERGMEAPSITLRYAAPPMANAVFPFMAVSNDETAREKIALLGCAADDSGAADITLFISAGDRSADTLGTRAPAAAYIKGQLAAGKHIALVDLSRRFSAEETLLPILVEHNVPVNALSAYAGWNTASNAIGTALSEAVLYHCALAQAQMQEEREAATYANVTFLTGRIAEDEFYLKEGIDRINGTLHTAGFTNTADLDLEKNARWANDLLARDLTRRIAAYESTAAFRAPFRVGSTTFQVRRSHAAAYFPWPRTFEIRMHTAPEMTITR